MNAIQFKDYFNIHKEISIIEIAQPLVVAEQVALIALKILSYITLIVPIICAFGLYAQRNIVSTPATPESGAVIIDSENITPTGESPKDPPFNFLLYCLGNDCEVMDSNYTTNMDRGWVYYGDKKGHVNLEAKKFHISIHRTNENLKNAFDIVLPILFKHGIHCFKFTNVNNTTSFEEGSNANGKEFCVYFHADKIDIMDRVAKEIEAGLRTGDIAQGRPSQGDILIPESQYIYYREDKNIFGDYVGADTLKFLMFTAFESAALSPSKTSQDTALKAPWDFSFPWPQGLPLSVSETIPNKDSFDTVKKQLLLDFENIQFLLPNSNRSMSFIPRQKIFPNDCSKDGLFLKSTTFIEIITVAAKEIAMRFKQMDLPEDQKPGNIAPALYHSIIVPLAQDLSSFSDIKENFETYLQENREAIISYLVDCGLRDRTKEQIRGKEAIYLEPSK